MNTKGTKFLVIAALLSFGCDAPKKADETAASASASASATASASAKPRSRKWKKMPFMTVDEDGVNMGGNRVDLSSSAAASALSALIKRLPLDSEEAGPPVVTALKKAKLAGVARLVDALGEGGASTVVLKTEGRGDLPKSVTLVPKGRLAKPAGCSVVVTTRKDLSTAVWTFKGGTATLHRKGFAGPDLSNTERTLSKRLKGCDSKTAFFSGAANVGWQLTYNMGALIAKVDTDKKIDKLVLLGEEPVAGRPLKLSP